MRIKNRISGFTLIELLVVIAIIGVLASIVLASLNNARRKSRDARRITDIKQIQLALELAFDSSSPPGYPGAVAPDVPCTNFGGLSDLVTKGYIPQVPQDPQSGCYKYATGGGGATYHLGATLEDATNPALKSDKDCDSSTGTGCPTGVSYAPVAAQFSGRGSNVENGDHPTNPVYDVIP